MKYFHYYFACEEMKKHKIIKLIYRSLVAFLVAQKLKNPPAIQWIARDCRCKRPGFIAWFGKIFWRRKWLTTPVFLPRESYGQRSLEGYSLWGHEESDTTEWPTLIWILIQVLTPGLMILSLVIVLDLSSIKTSWDSNLWEKAFRKQIISLSYIR